VSNLYNSNPEQYSSGEDYQARPFGGSVGQKTCFYCDRPLKAHENHKDGCPPKFGSVALRFGVVLCQWCGSPDTRVVSVVHYADGREVPEYRCLDCGRSLEVKDWSH
jgi:hypothetical protein